MSCSTDSEVVACEHDEIRSWQISFQRVKNQEQSMGHSCLLLSQKQTNELTGAHESSQASGYWRPTQHCFGSQSQTTWFLCLWCRFSPRMSGRINVWWSNATLLGWGTRCMDGHIKGHIHSSLSQAALAPEGHCCCIKNCSISAHGVASAWLGSEHLISRDYTANVHQK